MRPNNVSPPPQGTSFQECFKAYGSQIALERVSGAVEERYSFEELSTASDRLAAHLHLRGLREGDRVLLSGTSSPAWVACLFGIWKAGGVIVPVDSFLGDSERESLARFFHCKMTLFPEKENPFTLPETPPNKLFRPIPPVVEKHAAILMTSGSSGTPKGVVLSHAALLSNAENAIQCLDAIPAGKLGQVLPLHHAFPLTTTLGSLRLGRPVVFPVSLRPDDLHTFFTQGHPAALTAVPLLLHHLREVMERKGGWALGFLQSLAPILPQKWKRKSLKGLQSLRLIICGGAPLPPQDGLFFEKMGIHVAQGYGLTEAGPVVTLASYPFCPDAGVGQPISGVEIRVEKLEKDGAGEVLVKSPSLMLGYDQDEVSTLRSLRDGWLHTGDRGYLDPEGRLHLVGRVDSRITLPDGETVQAEVLESLYGQVPEISELAVVAGQKGPLVWIVPTNEWAQRGPDVLLSRLHSSFSRLGRHMPPSQRLSEVRFHKGPLPRTPAGKLIRHALPA